MKNPTAETILSPEEKAERQAEEDRREAKRVAKLSEEEVMIATDNGRYGPGLVGKALFERSQAISERTGGGMYGPALTDPDYAQKEAAKRAALVATEPKEETTVPAGDVDPANLTDPRNPWTYITRSGAKMLAQQAEVSYQPSVKREVLIADLQKKGVVPPPIPEEAVRDLKARGITLPDAKAAPVE